MLMQMRIACPWASGRCAERSQGAITAGGHYWPGRSDAEHSAMTTRGLNRGESMANFANGRTYCGSEIDHALH